jgi:fumarate reductase flavoprotein subunit
MDIFRRNIGRRQFISASSMTLGVGVLWKLSRPVAAAEGAPTGVTAIESKQYIRPIPRWAVPPEPLPEGAVTGADSADLVILGAGHAGICAARAAAEAGASVIVVEQQRDARQRVFGRDIGSINSKLALERGAPRYDPVELLHDWQLRSANKSNPDLVRQFAYNCGATVDWLLKPMDKKFISHIEIPYVKGNDRYPGRYNSFHSFIGTCRFDDKGFGIKELMKANQRLAQQAGARFFFQMAGDRLETKNGRVTALIAKNRSGAYYRFRAKKGVLLAAGDFGGNEEMVRDLCDEIDCLLDGRGKIASLGWNGSGIRMGLWAGGKLEAGPNATDGGGIGSSGGIMGGTAFLRINEYGKRYTDESFMCSVGIGSQAARQPEGKLAVVWDASWREELRFQATEHGNIDIYSRQGADFIAGILKQAVAAGKNGADFKDERLGAGRKKVYAANTLELLADYLGYSGKSKDNFLASVGRYNELAHKGVDEDFAKDPIMLHPVEKPPFYGSVEQKAGNVGSFTVTLGGLRINAEQQVLGEDYRPVPGLYASGNCSGGRFGPDYSTPMPGVSIGIAQTLGRLAGLHISGLSNEKEN